MSERTIIKSGSCLADWQKEANEERGENYRIDFTLSDDGVLTISGNTQLCAVPAPDAEPYYDEPVGPPCGWSEYVSQFKELDFHTVIIEEGVRVLGKECFKNCKNFRKIVLPEKMPVIRKDFAIGSPLEYTEKDGLLFLGPVSNPLYYLMEATDDFNNEVLVIPTGTVFIADETFKGKKCIKEVKFPDSLEFLGWYTFDGTSIKELFIPEGKLAYDEILIAFDGWDINLESISAPYSMYKEYKEGNDHEWVEVWKCHTKIIFRNPDDSIAEIIEPQPLEPDWSSEPENDNSSINKNSDELPF